MKKVLFLFCFCAIFIGLRFYSASFFSFKDHNLVADAAFSSDYCQAISEQIALLADQKNSARAAIEKIKKEFPLISTISIAFQPLQTIVTVNAQDPICIINDSRVLIAPNELCLKSAFATLAVADIPHVWVQSDDVAKTCQFLLPIFNALPSNFDEFYNLTFVNNHCIQLVDKKNSQFMILSEVERKDYSILLSQCEFIKKSLATRGAFNKNAEWIADSRFAHYIVVYKA